MSNGRSEYDRISSQTSDYRGRGTDAQITLTDGRLAVLLTEYAELDERIVERDREPDHGGQGTIPRSYSLAHYHSRQVEDLEGCRAEILYALRDEGMPIDHWVGYGVRAALLAENPPGCPERLQLYDCLWESLERAGVDATPLQIMRASRRLEFRNSLPGTLRVLLGLFESGERRSSVAAIELYSVILLIVLACTLASYLFAASAGVMIALILVSGFGGICAVDGLNAACRRLHGRMEDELERRERSRVPEPMEQVYVRGRPAEVEYPEPGEQSPVCEGRLDVSFVADGSRGRVALSDVKPAVSGHAPSSSASNRTSGFIDQALHVGHENTPATRTPK